MKKKILFAIITTLVIASCKKDNSTPATPPLELKFSAEALAYVQLPVNKYFIYKDSASGSLDSVVITKSSLETVLNPEYVGLFTNIPAFYYQTFTLKMAKYNSRTPEEWFYGVANNFSLSTYVSNTSAPLYLGEIDPITSAYRNVVFAYPFIAEQVGNHSINIFPTLNIEGNTYVNAVAFTYANETDPTKINYIKSTYYWVKGLGIIKREMQTYNSIKTYLLIRKG